MLRRILTALVAGSLVVGLLWVGKVGFLAVWGVAGLLLLGEWHRGEALPRPAQVASFLLIPTFWLTGLIPHGSKILSLLAGVTLALYLFTLNPEKDFGLSYRLAWGGVFLGLGWGSVAWLFAEEYRWERVLAFLSLVWVADSAAYFGGRFLGRRYILPRVSPKKTWEGFLIGTASTALWGHWAVPWVGGWEGIPPAGVGALTAVVAFLGDAWQSAWKRSLHLKDSGQLLPGHGGIWDRVDALLWVGPLWYVWS